MENEKKKRPAVAVKDEYEERQKRIRVLLWSFVLVILLVVSGFVAWMLLNSPGNPGATPNRPIEEMVFKPVNVFGDNLLPNEPEGLVYPEGIQEKYKRLYAANQDFVGWLKVPGTPTDTPIYKGRSNEYYIKRDLWSGAWSRYGTSFMDFQNDPLNLNRNTVIYGHSFANEVDSSQEDRIFGAIEKYRDLEFYKKNPVIEFNTLYKDYKWKVIACFVTNGDAHNIGDNGYLFYYIAPHMNNQSFMQFIDEINQRSFIHTGVDVNENDKILTLSTCTYYLAGGGRLTDERFAVIARMVREGESEEVDVSRAVKNENIRFPQIYYTVRGGTNPYKDASKWYPQS